MLKEATPKKKSQKADTLNANGEAVKINKNK